jgi:hypothetical protein
MNPDDIYSMRYIRAKRTQNSRTNTVLKRAAAAIPKTTGIAAHLTKSIFRRGGAERCHTIARKITMHKVPVASLLTTGVKKPIDVTEIVTSVSSAVRQGMAKKQATSAIWM